MEESTSYTVVPGGPADVVVPGTTALSVPDEAGAGGEKRRRGRGRTVTVPEGVDLVPVDRRTDAADGPAGLVRLAVQQGLDIDRLRELMALQREWEGHQARKAFFDALSKFQSELPPIVKANEADAGRGGKRRYASLGTINEAIRPYLYANGLSYRFRQQQGPQGITVTCVVSHRDGHSEETTLTAGADGSGAKNAIQSVGSTITYLERYTLTAALGLTAVDDDDDGQDSGPAVTPDQQRANQLELARAAAAGHGNPAPEAPREPAGENCHAADQAAHVAPPAASSVAEPMQPAQPPRIKFEQFREMMGLLKSLFATSAGAFAWLSQQCGRPCDATTDFSAMPETVALGVLSALYALKHERNAPQPPPAAPTTEPDDGRATQEQRAAIRQMTTELYHDRAAEEQANWLRSLGYSSANSCTRLQAAERIAALDAIMHPKAADADIPF